MLRTPVDAHAVGTRIGLVAAVEFAMVGLDLLMESDGVVLGFVVDSAVPTQNASVCRSSQG